MMMMNFKIPKMKKWAWLIIFSAIVVGCETNRETFEDFVREGETIYVGAADTVLVGSGFDKLRFWVAINADPKIKKGIIISTDNSINHEFDVERKQNGSDTITFDLEIPEGEYTFGLYMMDAAGNTSVRREVPAKVYGPKYQAGLVNRGINDIIASSNTATVEWSEAALNMIGTELLYEDQSGTLQSVNVPNDQNTTIIEGYKLGGEVQIKSVFKPTALAIEEFVAEPSERTFPTEYLVDKSFITALRLPYDASDGCYGSSYARLTDGETNEFWHSCEDEQENAEDLYPWVMSFDLGEAANISKFRLDEREGCCGDRSPAAYQIWGTNDINNAETVDIDAVSLDEWERDAREKGWVKLLDVSGNSQPTIEVELLETNKSYKYVRIVGISSIGGGLAANFNELTFWSR
jgi:hypothetical protein